MCILFRRILSTRLLVGLFTFPLLLTTCQSAVKLTDAQKQTISAEAQQYYAENKLIRLPFLSFSEGISEMLVKRARERNAPLLRKYLPQYGITTRRDTMAGVPVVVLMPPADQRNPNGIGLYTHGGGFVAVEPDEYFILDMVHRLGIPVISVAYSFSPKVKYPVAVNECFAVYRSVVQIYAGKKVVVLGTSAGGNLALTTVLKAREAGLPLPVATVLVTPWTDLTGAGDTYVANDGRDILPWDNSLQKAARAYVGEQTNWKDPYISPIYADYTNGFPPSIITTGTRDLFLSNSVRLHTLLKRAKIPVTLTVYEGMWHGFNTIPDLPEGRECNQEIEEFIKPYLASKK